MLDTKQKCWLLHTPHSHLITNTCLLSQTSVCLISAILTIFLQPHRANTSGSILLSLSSCSVWSTHSLHIENRTAPHEPQPAPMMMCIDMLTVSHRIFWVPHLLPVTCLIFDLPHAYMSTMIPPSCWEGMSNNISSFYTTYSLSIVSSSLRTNMDWTTVKIEFFFWIFKFSGTTQGHFIMLVM